jgi:hypothetical protein
MSRHRLDPPARVRARYGRMAAAVVSVAVTMVALLGGIGVLPLQASGGSGDQTTPAASRTKVIDAGSAAGAPGASADTSGTAASRSLPDGSVGGALQQVADPPPQTVDPTALPAGSGTGRRVVFSKSAQRVWLVDAKESVLSTYLVSGSVTNNLHPGTYAVYSRSRWAVGVDDSGVMQYFVRFAHGPHAAIGFHSIPTKRGTPLQSVAQLGTPQSHGCIRQKVSDAVRMWDFAAVGTDVVVLA